MMSNLAQKHTNSQSSLLQKTNLRPIFLRKKKTYYGRNTSKNKPNNTFFSKFPFTSKELDKETGLYYYGFRYLDPKISRWLSVDPALTDGYIPVAPNDDEARKHNQNLPGMGGVFNYVNLHVYHYGGNNPIKYVDPDGRCDEIYAASQDEQKAIENQINRQSQQNDRKTYSNSSTLFSFIPIDGPVAPGSAVAIGLFGATITTNVIAESNSITVFSNSTRGPLNYEGLKVNTTAHLSVDGVVVDTATLTQQPSLLPANLMSLGAATLNIPTGNRGNTEVITTTAWSIGHDTGRYRPIIQTVTVKIGVRN